MANVDPEKITPVFALKIVRIGEVANGQCTLTLESGQDVSDPVVVTEEYLQKYDPQPGGYYIMCEGGIGLYSI
ncbi:TPA: hypothetical protein L9R01_001608 [Klebsiella pneumoniae]|uniref:hypothetical protein n=1 Tax=Klebsiella pneumoniae TaxID=573 RepID=UPI0009497D94|nr:hypothetical protein [Klebsiella pneumoniae]EIX9347108.1 hypothetical protein [Klebsiella pneumoniae]EIY2213590.1 hypothetical protein [Klebsiella pneumoniae]EKV6267136.1 hypothetical protein [Klebsiella pneumoniae]EKW9740287.1 hypothetical protein [Klebsiella pneumoniae]ELA2306066.1 hypothetical protein [Klebsiella pneumoniae]